MAVAWHAERRVRRGRRGLVLLLLVACGCGGNEQAARLRDDLARSEAEKTRLARDLAQAKRRANELADRLDAAEEATRRARSRTATLEKGAADAKKELAELEADHRRLGGVLERLRGRAEEPRPGPDEAALARAIRGRVTAVDRQRGQVVLDVGAEQGVAVGQTLEVVRGGRHVGEVVVEDVRPDSSVAHYDARGMAGGAEVGDEVTTRLAADGP